MLSLVLVVVAVVSIGFSLEMRGQGKPFRIVEASIPEMRTAMTEKRLTSRELVSQYLIRLALYEHRLHAALAVNPHALDEAETLDRERAAGKLRGPLHGIPIALKDNIHTTDLPTTGGALAFAGYRPPYDATLARNLRDAGAIIIAKTGLTELANWVAGAPTPMPGNYNAVGGFGFNPYDPRADPRDATFDGRPVLQTGGSSRHRHRASFWAASVGTDTGGSVISPSNANMLMASGRRSAASAAMGHPDHRRSRHRRADGPHRHHAAIPSARRKPVPRSARSRPRPARRRRGATTRNSARRCGRRIGIGARSTTIASTGGGLNADQAKAMADAIDVLEQTGAVVVDPADVPSFVDKDPRHNFTAWDYCSGADQARGKDEQCSVAFKYGMKRDFNLWLKTLGASAPVASLTALREWNLAHAGAGAIKYGQSRLDISDEMDLEADRARYEADRRKDLALSRGNGIDGVLKAHQLDAILTPGGAGAGLAARAGYPIIVVPFAMVPNAPTPALPDRFDAKPAPFGVGFTGASCSEPRLIELAYAFEQATKRRVPPLP